MNRTEGLSFIFINGRGSAGKDTQANLITEEYPHATTISTGNIYRGAKSPDGEFGRFFEQIKPFIEKVDNGGYVDDAVMLPIVREVIIEHIQAGKKMFVFTGFPRTIGQLRGFDQILKAMSTEHRLSAEFIYLAVADETSARRARIRRDEALRKRETPRNDDEESVVKHRLTVFKELTLPMLHQLSKENRLHIIRANKSVEDVADQLFCIINAG